MINPEISVIMAAYNAEKYLDESIRSILNQTFYNFELIIVNDKSTDNSLTIIQNHQAKDKRIILINNTKNRGPGVSRNIALKVARGRYIAILDADDVSLPTRLEVQYQFLQKNPDTFLCGTGIFQIDENNNIIDKTSKTVVGYNQIRKILPRNNCISHSTVMYKRSNLTYREKFIYAQDYDFYLLLLSKDLKLENIEDKLVKYRNCFDNISCSKKNKQDFFAKKARDFYIQRVKYGHDKYNEFNSSEVLKTNDVDPKKVLLKFKLGLCLENKDFQSAKNILTEYEKLPTVYFFETLPYLLALKYPRIYKRYRKYRYGEKL